MSKICICPHLGHSVAITAKFDLKTRPNRRSEWIATFDEKKFLPGFEKPNKVLEFARRHAIYTQDRHHCGRQIGVYEDLHSTHKLPSKSCKNLRVLRLRKALFRLGRSPLLWPTRTVKGQRTRPQGGPSGAFKPCVTLRGVVIFY